MKYKKQTNLYLLVCFCLLVIAMSIFIFASKNYNKTVSKIVEFDEKNIESVFLRVTDVYDEDGQKTLSQFFEEKDSLARMKEFSRIINKKFNFLEFDHQTLLLENNSNNADFHFKNEFREDYGTEIWGENDHIGISFQSLQIGENAFNFFSLRDKIIKGKGIERDDFIFKNRTIPAVLGYEYLDIVSIGDTITFNYLFKDITIKVEGFLEKDSSIGIDNQIYFLDRYIIIPSLKVNSDPKTHEEESFQKTLYSLKNWGYIQIKNGENYYTYKNEVDKISNSLDLKYVLEEGIIGSHMRNISNTINSSKGLFLIASNFLFLLLAIVFTYIYIWNFNRNRKNYAIKLICGCTVFKLKSQIFGEIFAQFFVAAVLSYFINKFLLRKDIVYLSERVLLNKSMGQALLLSSIVMLGIFIILNIYINKSNLYSCIQTED